MLREGDQRVIREVIRGHQRSSEVIRGRSEVIRGAFTRACEHDRAEEFLVITLDALGHVAQLCMHVALACIGVERVPVGNQWAP
jgi:hypothetical protein